MKDPILIAVGLFVVLFSTADVFAQADAAPAEIQKYVESRGGRKKLPTEINKIVMGDLNRDGKEDAVVQYIIQEGYPGNYFSSHIAVFLKQRGKFVFATTMNAGTKLTSGLVPEMVLEGKIVVDRYPANSNTKSDTIFYKLLGKRLVKTTMPKREMRLDRITKLGSTDSDTGYRVVQPGESYPSGAGGVLNGKATSLPKPAYPPAARAVKASGAVSVQVLINETGNVISANAVSGHPLLRAAAEAAARGARFSPTLLAGQPVKVSGVIVYNFVP